MSIDENSIMSSKEYDDLSDRIKKLSHSVEIYKLQVNIIGGIFIGIIVLLVIGTIWMIFLLFKLRRQYGQKLKDMDPLRRFTIARPHLKPTPSRPGSVISNNSSINKARNNN